MSPQWNPKKREALANDYLLPRYLVTEIDFWCEPLRGAYPGFVCFPLIPNAHSLWGSLSSRCVAQHAQTQICTT